MRNIYLAIFLLIAPISNVFSKSSNQASTSKYSFIGIAYPPYIAIDKNGDGAGLFVEVARDLAIQMGESIPQVKVLPPRRTLQSIKQNETMILLSSRAYFSQEQNQGLIFVEAFPLEVALFGTKGSTKDLDLSKDLKGKKFAVLAGESFQKEFVAQKKGERLEVESVEQMLRMVQSGRADYGFCIPIACDEAIRSSGLSVQKFDYRSKILSTVPADFILMKTSKNQDYAKQMEKALKLMRQRDYFKKKGL